MALSSFVTDASAASSPENCSAIRLPWRSPEPIAAWPAPSAGSASKTLALTKRPQCAADGVWTWWPGAFARRRLIAPIAPVQRLPLRCVKRIPGAACVDLLLTRSGIGCSLARPALAHRTPHQTYADSDDKSAICCWPSAVLVSILPATADTRPAMSESNQLRRTFKGGSDIGLEPQPVRQLDQRSMMPFAVVAACAVFAAKLQIRCGAICCGFLVGKPAQRLRAAWQSATGPPRWPGQWL